LVDVQPSLTFAQAFARVLGTAQGARLYDTLQA